MNHFMTHEKICFKGTDQLHWKGTADQCLHFCYSIRLPHYKAIFGVHRKLETDRVISETVL